MLRSIPSIAAFGAALILAATTLIGCANSPARPSSVSTQSAPSPQIIALINNTPVTADQLRDDLYERAGRQALMDLVLDRMLIAELEHEGFQISDEDLADETSLFVRTIDGTLPNAQSVLMLKQLRQSQGLGPNRYPRFIRRNAMLRKLALPKSEPSESEYLLAEQIALGTRYRIRLAVFPTRTQASTFRQQVLDATPESRRWVFAQGCARNSIHPSAPRGGLIPEMSPHDPTYPDAFAQAVISTQGDKPSPLIALDQGYAIVLVESTIEPSEPSPAQTESIRDRLRMRKARVEMQKLAERLLRQAQIIVTDPSLNWTWTNRP